MRGKTNYILSGLLALIMSLTMFNREAKASHAMGADLTYQCLGGNVYKVRLSFYRDCIGIPAPLNVYVNVKSTSCGKNLGVTCNPVPGTGQEVTYLCPTSTSTCNGGTFTGIQEWVYEGVITLPNECPDWEFSYTLCCRNAAISTISNPGGSTFYLYARLNNVGGVCNNAPIFTNKPVPFACLGQQLFFNHGASDPDGDSLAYTLITPKQTATTNVLYNAPYSATNPIASNPAFQFNNANGDVSFTPTQLQVTVMAVLVSEYRNGQLIGSVVRDIQVTVLNCANDLPTLTGINGTNNYNISVCANQPLCFNVFSNDVNAGQQISLQYNNGIPGATFSQSGSPFPTGTFCWTPGTDDISPNPYCFTLQAKDNACPYNGANTYSYCVTVKGLVVDAGADQQIACNDLATISANVTGSGGPFTYLWSNGFTGPTQTVPVGTYVVTVSDGLCSATDTVNVTGAFEPIALFNWTGGCANSTIQFNDMSTTQGGLISWFWNFGNGNTSGLQNPSMVFPAAGTYNVSLAVSNIYGCTDTVVLPVTITNQPQASFTSGTACLGSPIQFTNTSQPVGTSWNWSFSNGNTSVSQNPSVVFGTSGSQSATLIVSNAQGCSDTVVHAVNVLPPPIAAFTVSSSNCQGSPVVFNNTSVGGTSYFWSFGDSSSAASQNPTHIYSTGGTYNVTLTVVNAAGCTASVSQPVQVNMPPMIYAGPDQSICLGSTIGLNASGGVSYVWSPGGMTGGSVSVSPSATTTYIVTGTNAIGCTSVDTVLVNVYQLPVPTISSAQSICLGDSVVLVSGGGVSYQWNPSGVNNDTLVVTPGGSTTYSVNVLDANGCQATAFVNVVVQPNPSLNLSPGVFICSGVSTVLDPGLSGVSYLWSNGSTASTISVNSQGTYTVTVTNASGCTASASTQVTVAGQVISNNNAITICQGQSATLSAGQTGVSYSWSTGAVTPVITVSAAGTYSVTVTDASGCTGTLAHTVQVNPLPQAMFTPNDECLNDSVFFFDVSVVNGGTISSWSWDLGDGNISFAQNPTHVYNTPGSYVIGLTVTSSDGCQSSLQDLLNIYPMPQAAFSVAPACEGSPVVFTDQSSVGFGNIVSWNWNFGDGSGSNLQHPQHVYTAPGNYIATLDVMTPGGCLGTFSSIVQVYPKPQLSFSPAASTLCGSGQINLTNTSTSANGNISSWQWSFGNGQTSSQYNPSVNYAAPGNYQIALIATTSLGCTDTALGSVTINPLPVINAGSIQQICAGENAVLTASASGSIFWSPGGGTTTSITVSPASSTVYSAMVTDAAGCTATDSVTVIVNQLPQLQVSPDNTICIGDSVQLTATGGVSYLWNPGAATTASVWVSPAANSTYSVITTGAQGCTTQASVNVFVDQPPVGSAGPDISICSGETAVLTAAGGTAYFWHHNGASSATVAVSPQAATDYTVIVSNSNGCTSTDTIRVNVNPTPQLNGGNALFCTGFSVTLDAGVAGLSYEWAPNGETTQTISVSDTGTYSVVATNSFGCQGSGWFSVIEGGSSLNSQPVNVLACQGSNVQLDAGNPGMSYLWSTGQTTQTISVNNSGAYDVTISDPAGCSATITNAVTILAPPQVNIQAADACEGNTVSVSNNSTVGSGQSIISWKWVSNGSVLSNLQYPSLQFNSPGTYNIQLIATTGAGCADSASTAFQVHPNPDASFFANRVCEGVSSNFTNVSTVATGGWSGWQWNFGDGNTSSVQNPQHQFAQPGTYVSTLTVTSAAGCSDNVQATVIVDDAPVALFTAPDVCEGEPMPFTNLAQSSLMISDVNWDFGDGNVSTDYDPVHTYALPGTYQVTLRVGNSGGCENEHTHTVQVNPKPLASFTAPDVCTGTSIQFLDQSSVNGGVATSWYWQFGDGGFSSAQNPIHSYSNNGVFDATLVTYSNRGCSDTLTSQVTVNPVPAASFTVSNTCEGSPVQFQDLSTLNGGNINFWYWTFGDGTTSVLQNPSHQFAAAGMYNVSLQIGTSNGCFADVSATVNVFPVPVAAFSVADVCLNTIASFIDQSQISGGSTFDFQWNFGDNSISTDQQPVHLYQSAGDYTVTLTVTTPYGCTSTVNEDISVFPNPVASFTASNACLNEPVMLLDQSTVSSGNISAWNWSLGDSAVSTAQNPTHFYNIAGQYNVTLSVQSDEGCISNYSSPVEIYLPPTPMPASGNTCVGAAVAFADTSSGASNIVSGWNWNFGDGTSSTLSAPNHTYSLPGSYVVNLTTTNSNGCKATATINVDISPLPDAGFTAPTACLNTPLQFTNASSIPNGTITGFEWIFGDGSPASNLENPGHTFAQAGNYTVTLIVTGGDGCRDTVQRMIVVNPLPVAAFSNISAAGCGPLPVPFMDSSYISSGNIVSWNWSFGDGGVSSIQNPVHIYQSSGNYPIELTVTSDSGCVNTYSQSNAVTIYPGPLAEFEAEPWEQDILNPTFQFINLSSGGLNYNWTFGDGGLSTAFEPEWTYRDTGDYMVTLWVTNAYGCRDSVRHPVRVKPIFSWWIPNAFTPNGDGTNEDFNVKGEYIANVELTIFNRWGESIFFNEGKESAAWDGSIDGSPDPAKEDVYVYQVKLLDVWGKYHEKVGHVTLVR